VLASGAVLSQPVAPSSDGSLRPPVSLNATRLAALRAGGTAASASATNEACGQACPSSGFSTSISFCSTLAVLPRDSWLGKPVSWPVAMSSTPSNTAPPMPRRSHWPTPSERLSSAKTRPPASNANASDVAAPAA
jgi:hypothetical protein